MKVLKIDFCMDGGTAIVTTDQGDFFIDGRLQSSTVGAVYDKYPDEAGAKRVDFRTSRSLLSAVRIYGVDPIYGKEIVDSLISSMSSFH